LRSEIGICGVDPVLKALWRWLGEDVTAHHCRPTAEDLCCSFVVFEAWLNQEPYTVADSLRIEERLDPEKERLRFPKPDAG
jgi:hypothetical protein